MSDSIVLELQHESLDSKVPISDLLRKAMVVAKKLNIEELQDWIANELNGYSDDKSIPEYRLSLGQIRGWNPARGWIPVILTNPKTAEKLSKRNCGQSVAELENLLHNISKSNELHMPYPPGLQKLLIESTGFSTEFALIVPRTVLVKILDSVRNIILNWTLRLEQQGILGEGLKFTQEEKTKASGNSYNINNFYGNVQGTQIQQDSKHSTQVLKNTEINIVKIKEFVDELDKSIDVLELQEDEKEELSEVLATLKVQVESKKPKKNIIGECLSSARAILEGATGSLAVKLFELLASI